MKNFYTLVAATAIIAGSAEAVNQTYMYDPLALSQTTLGKSAKEPASTVVAKDAAKTKPAIAKVNAPTKDPVAIKNKWCIDSVTATFMNAGDAPKTPLEQFTEFTNTICPQLEAEVPMGVVVSQCFHTGYFMLRELNPLAEKAKGADGAQFKKDFNDYVEDFCETYDEVLPKRTGFVRAINGIEDPKEFQDACFKELSETPNLNKWFDPIDPLSSITQKEICDLHFKLFASLKAKQRTSLAEYVSFSYIASLDLFLNAHMQEDLENCVNSHVKKHPNQWVSAFVSEHTAFKNWEHNLKTEQAAEVATAVDSVCLVNPQCDACSTAISRVYFSYQTYLNNLFAATFKTHSEKMFDSLHQANMVLETAAQPN